VQGVSQFSDGWTEQSKSYEFRMIFIIGNELKLTILKFIYN
jgi:hypothetical protein